MPTELKLLLHYQRLSNSARALGIPLPEYKEFTALVLTSCKNSDAVKIVLEALGSSRPTEDDLSSRMLYFGFSHEINQKPLRLCICEYKRHSLDPTARHKTTNYLFNLLSRKSAKERGFDDCIILNELDEVCETTSANLIFFKGGKLFTPESTCGLLVGTTLMALSKKVSISQIRIKIDKLKDFEHVFAINSLNLIRSVEQIDGLYFKVNKSLEEELNIVLRALCIK